MGEVRQSIDRKQKDQQQHEGFGRDEQTHVAFRSVDFRSQFENGYDDQKERNGDSKSDTGQRWSVEITELFEDLKAKSTRLI